MYKKLTIFVLLMICLIGCEKSLPEKADTQPNNIAPALNIDNENPKYREFYGNWVGNFEAKTIDDSKGSYVWNNKLNLIIEKITVEKKVYGKSVVAGNYRDFQGDLVENKDGTVQFILNEPGDQKYDGVFNLTYYPQQDSLGGIWDAINKNIPVTSREAGLKKKIFKYNPNNMLPSAEELSDESGEGYTDWYNSKQVTVKEGDDTYTDDYYRSASKAVTQLNGSTQKLTDKDLKNLRKLDLEIIRNTIYARHGFTFGKKSVRQFFDWVDWYIPVTNDVAKDLTPLEKQNIALLKRYEKYAEDSYDTFGR